MGNSRGGSAWRRIWPRIAALFGRASSNELIRHEWQLLQDLWNDRKMLEPALDATTSDKIDELFAGLREISDAEGWADFNEAELRVGSFLTPAQLKSEFKLLLQIATTRSLSSLPVHEANKTLFADSANLEEARAAYKALLGALQSDFIDSRFRRRLRSEVAQRLFRYGVAALIVAIGAPLALVLNSLDPVQATVNQPPNVLTRFSNEPIFTFVMVSAFGVLGAYFSRVIAFQTSIATLTFDNVMQLYIGRLLRMRMLYGMIGALIFYFVLRGGLLGGSMFPDLSKLGIGEQIVWRLTPQGAQSSAEPTALDPAGLTILAPTADMAKLLVWSFLAGFSERLVPDTLSRTEARASADES